MTATTRVGISSIYLSGIGQAHIILDLMHGIYNYDDKNVWTFVRVENDHRIVGYRQTNGWARTRTVYFAMEFSKPFKNYGFKNFGKEDYKGFWRKFDQTKNFPEMAGKQIRAHFDFDTKARRKNSGEIRTLAGFDRRRDANMKTETPDWDFEKVKTRGQAEWNRELGKIAVTMLDEGEMTNFYTAMYHTFLSPTVYMDTDGKYKGLDQNVHQAKGFTNYTTFSLWDTYRALHPFFNIVQPKRNRDMVNSMLAHYDQSVHKMLPVWSHYANENWCMIGYHRFPSLRTRSSKATSEGIDAKQALEAMADRRHGRNITTDLDSIWISAMCLRTKILRLFRKLLNMLTTIGRSRKRRKKLGNQTRFTTNLSSVRKIGKTSMMHRAVYASENDATGNSSKNSIR